MGSKEIGKHVCVCVVMYVSILPFFLSSFPHAGVVQSVCFVLDLPVTV